MHRALPHATIALAAAALVACTPQTTPPDPTPTTAAAPTINRNDRGAIEAPFGDTIRMSSPVTERIADITPTQLTAAPCDTDSRATALRRQLHATVDVGPVSQIQWLWQSDFYYVNGAGKVTRNYDIVDTTVDCTDSAEAIDVPPNSTFDVRVDITVPSDTVAIGYRAEVGQDSQRVEWTLPVGWQSW